MRVKKQGLKGLEASTIGLTLVGYIAAGFFIGQWLDARFNTAFWMPLLVLVGTGAGFRDILKVVTRMGAHSKESGQDRAVGRPMMAPADLSRSAPTIEDAAEEVDDRPRPSIFSVPPPPRASFDKTVDDETDARSTPGLFATEDESKELGSEAEDDKTLMEQLLADEEKDNDTK